MFNVRPRPRPQLLTSGPPPKRRKTNSSAPAEITFDPAAREEYLTGFHKRKEARKKHAQEENAKKEKEEKLRFRREIRQQRKEDLERHVSEVNTLLRRANGDLSDPGASSDSNEEEEEWQGFTDPAVPEPIDHEEEYIDEDKYTTVTVESVGISRDGFEKVGEKKEQSVQQTPPEKKKRVWTVEKPKSTRPTVKKKKFRYESPADRKAARMKIGAKNRAAAEARKGK